MNDRDPLLAIALLARAYLHTLDSAGLVEAAPFITPWEEPTDVEAAALARAARERDALAVAIRRWEDGR